MGNVRAVLPDRVLDDARVVVRDGLIAAVDTGRGRFDVDGAGAFCLPGLVDVHSDGLEKERMPRPGAELPWLFGVMSFEGKLRAAGITTVFHGASFSDREAVATGRSVGAARELCGAVAEWSRPTTCENGNNTNVCMVDHRILHRLDVRSRAGLDALREHLAAAVGAGDVTPETPAAVSHEDHTPGIGQYADRTYYERHVAGLHGLTADQAREHVDTIVRTREANLAVRDDAMGWLADRAVHGLARVFGHDPESSAEIADLAARGGHVAEFPTTLDAARAARARDMSVVMGAPNVLRGGSHSGNVSAAELAAEGLVTALASDYLPSSLLGAVFTLAARGAVPLPRAAALVTSGAAAAVGLTDRGTLAEGLRADLTLVTYEREMPVVRAVLRDGSR
nr:alpha-D-ribose 1-methylphosphonate 5-triphosphate diphosphatase [Rhodococcus sp. HNM0569]